MDAVDRLTREHGFLRSKLRLLESALGMSEEAWFVVRGVSVTLWKELQAHGRREEKIFVTCRAALGRGQWTPVMVDHAAEQEDLLIMKQLFMEEPQSFEALRPKLAEVVTGLRCQMDQHETKLFTALEEAVARAAAPSVDGKEAAGVLAPSDASPSTSTRRCKSANV